METILNAFADDIWVLIPLTALAIGLISVVGGLVATHCKNKNFERSRREIAAYVAEGSISPEEGERLLAARAPKC